ncbi:uncharacterized protein METZ01_LOCUS7992 [marine metagenome]|uniref:Uncharacterized protein n=1 Tax=marine metagenome TaxID=408172 RepID=A0A381NMU6_9ZZZZ
MVSLIKSVALEAFTSLSIDIKWNLFICKSVHVFEAPVSRINKPSISLIFASI